MRAIKMALAAGVVCFAPIAATHSAQDEGTALQGIFVNDGQASYIIANAVDAAVAKMNFIKRPIARSRLKKTNPLYERIEISRTGSTISIKFDAGKPVLMPADGTPAKWTRADGEQFDVTGRLEGDQLVQTFTAEDGKRVNIFSVSADGKLLLQVMLTSPQLPEAVRYQLAYRRESR
ncbi:MAG TPA: hypothetical protein VGN07_13565 [Steroidobacteraceae bacterium]|jgi:hypothetical protein